MTIVSYNISIQIDSLDISWCWAPTSSALNTEPGCKSLWHIFVQHVHWKTSFMLNACCHGLRQFQAFNSAQCEHWREGVGSCWFCACLMSRLPTLLLEEVQHSGLPHQTPKSTDRRRMKDLEVLGYVDVDNRNCMWDWAKNSKIHLDSIKYPSGWMFCGDSTNDLEMIWVVQVRHVHASSLKTTPSMVKNTFESSRISKRQLEQCASNTFARPILRRCQWSQLRIRGLDRWSNPDINFFRCTGHR